MRFDSFLIELVATPTYILGSFVFMLVCMHLVLVKWIKLDDIAWKHIDYIWLGTAALGLLTSSGQADRFISQRYLQNFEAPRTATAYHFLRATLAGPPGVCAPRIRSKSSPENFDDIVKEQQALCRRATEIALRMPESFQNGYPPLEQTGYEPLGVNTEYQLYFVREVNDRALEYQKQQQRYTDFVNSTKISDSEIFILMLGPMLLSFALALRITKVTGDIRNARSKNAA